MHLIRRQRSQRRQRKAAQSYDWLRELGHDVGDDIDSNCALRICVDITATLNFVLCICARFEREHAHRGR